MELCPGSAVAAPLPQALVTVLPELGRSEPVVFVQSPGIRLSQSGVACLAFVFKESVRVFGSTQSPLAARMRHSEAYLCATFTHSGLRGLASVFVGHEEEPPASGAVSVQLGFFTPVS